MLPLKKKIIYTFFAANCFFNLALGGELQEKDHTVNLESAQNLLQTLDSAIEAGGIAKEAIVSAYRLEQNIVLFGKTALQNGGELFRSGSSYKQEFADTAITDPKAMKYLQSTAVSQLTRELDIIKEDMELFINSPAILKSIQEFTSTHRNIVNEVHQVQNFMGDGGHTFLSFFVNSDKISPENLKKITSFLEEDYDHFISSPETENTRKSYFAALYILLNIFKNDHSKFSLLFNNRQVVQHISSVIKDQYGKNPMLSFATKIAPYIAIMENSQLLSNIWSYCFSTKGLVILGSMGVTYYLFGGKIQSVLHGHQKIF